MNYPVIFLLNLNPNYLMAKIIKKKQNKTIKNKINKKVDQLIDVS